MTLCWKVMSNAILSFVISTVSSRGLCICTESNSPAPAYLNSHSPSQPNCFSRHTVALRGEWMVLLTTKIINEMIFLFVGQDFGRNQRACTIDETYFPDMTLRIQAKGTTPGRGQNEWRLWKHGCEDSQTHAADNLLRETYPGKSSAFESERKIRVLSVLDFICEHLLEYATILSAPGLHSSICSPRSCFEAVKLNALPGALPTSSSPRPCTISTYMIWSSSAYHDKTVSLSVNEHIDLIFVAIFYYIVVVSVEPRMSKCTWLAWDV